MKDDNPFPSELEPEFPKGFPAQMVEMMRRIHEQPDSRSYEWRVSLVKLPSADLEQVSAHIQAQLNDGFSERVFMCDVQDDYFFWSGARKKEGE